MSQIGKYAVITNNDNTTTVFIPNTQIKHTIPIEWMIDNYIEHHRQRIITLVKAYEAADWMNVGDDEQELIDLVPHMPETNMLPGNLPEDKRKMFHRRLILQAYNAKHKMNFELELLKW